MGDGGGGGLLIVRPDFLFFLTQPLGGVVAESKRESVKIIGVFRLMFAAYS